MTEMSGEKVKPQGNRLQRTVRAEKNYFRVIKLDNFTIKVPLLDGRHNAHWQP